MEPNPCPGPGDEGVDVFAGWEGEVLGEAPDSVGEGKSSWRQWYPGGSRLCCVPTVLPSAHSLTPYLFTPSFKLFLMPGFTRGVGVEDSFHCVSFRLRAGWVSFSLGHCPFLPHLRGPLNSPLNVLSWPPCPVSTPRKEELESWVLRGWVISCESQHMCLLFS